MVELDSIDRRLLSLLRHNGREPIASIAQKLGISRVTARSRLERLLANGIIESFTITLGSGVQSRMIRAIMLVKIEGTKSDHVVRELNKITEVVDLYSTSGQWDSIAILEADTLTHFDLTLRAISRISGIKMTETSMMLSSRRAFP
ncbi:Lrp/AsnC family transcriptional regulator [Shinella sp. G-2]|uniref:Lrp/AsnC family transcriptional regulator n=1 Tax=Shinella sp. G-2 TaxID=3133141 RepID=UPI003D01A58B